MRILFLCQYFPPEIGAPSARTFEHAREWVRQGHDVLVVTGFPDHPTGVVPPEYRGRLFQREESRHQPAMLLTPCDRICRGLHAHTASNQAFSSTPPALAAPGLEG